MGQDHMTQVERKTEALGIEPSARKAAMISWMDRVAEARDQWLRRNDYFHLEHQRYMQFLVPKNARILDLGCGTGQLLAALEPSHGVGMDFSANMVKIARTNFPALTFEVGDAEDPSCLDRLEGPFDVIMISDTIGYFEDCETALRQLHRLCTPDTRIVIAYYSRYWEPILRVAEICGAKMRQPSLNWLSTGDIGNLLHLADFDIVKREWRQLVPRRLLGLGPMINRFIGTLPGIRRLSLRNYLVARPMPEQSEEALSVTVLVPCRNERGNIESAVQRMPRFAEDMEILFVEGNSSDGTFEECERVRDAYAGQWDIKAIRQEGKGKGDAVRKGFDLARCDVLMILDSDLTMPPEDLPKYYAALRSGKGEFINGSRLVYPMESEAMRFLNWVANQIFSVLFSWLLNQRFTDTLCGTKVLRKRHYEKIAENRDYFGEFDPFGDFDLIFGATKLNLKVAEVPIRYASRTYGETQISRFSHGWLLVRMVVFAFFRLKAF
jgi:ubiquinone/menaquinone biosynthesis C-methylase UbiE